jgi:hypothetical protein
MPEDALFSVKPMSVEIAASSGSPISLSAKFSLEADIRSQRGSVIDRFQPSRKTRYGLSVHFRCKNSRIAMCFCKSRIVVV